MPFEVVRRIFKSRAPYMSLRIVRAGARAHTAFVTRHNTGRVGEGFDGITDRKLAVGCMKTPHAGEVCALVMRL